MEKISRKSTFSYFSYALQGLLAVGICAGAAYAGDQDAYKVTKDNSTRGFVFGSSAGISFMCDGEALTMERSSTNYNKEVRFTPKGPNSIGARDAGHLCDIIYKPDGLVQKQCLKNPTKSKTEMGPAESIGRIVSSGTTATGLYYKVYNAYDPKKESGRVYFGYTYWSAVDSGVYASNDKKVGTIAGSADDDMIATTIVAFFSACK